MFLIWSRCRLTVVGCRRRLTVCCVPADGVSPSLPRQSAAAAGAPQLGAARADGPPVRPPAAGPHAQRVQRTPAGGRHLQLRRAQPQQVAVSAALAGRVVPSPATGDRFTHTVSSLSLARLGWLVFMLVGFSGATGRPEVRPPRHCTGSAVYRCLSVDI